MILRTREWWEDRALSDPPDRRGAAGPKRLALLERDGAAAGYAIYRHRFGFEQGSSASKLEVVEAIGVDPAAAASVWRFLLDIDWTATITASLVPPDHPLFFLLGQPRRMKYRMGDGLWVRLVDVGAALAGRTYAEDGELVLEVRDALCPWNEGRWRLAAAAERPTRPRTSRSTSRRSARRTSAACAWRRSPRAAGRGAQPGAIERADGIFRHGLHPWCPEIF